MGESGKGEQQGREQREERQGRAGGLKEAGGNGDQGQKQIGWRGQSKERNDSGGWLKKKVRKRGIKNENRKSFKAMASLEKRSPVCPHLHKEKNKETVLQFQNDWTLFGSAEIFYTS